ncbi:uncharacterized protein LOC122920836 [Bufo gargarizans]|uniref:uncharacterized protein LOC122920836 n=1 Tax=Bufo gargarizans TaxID=30331 RepID=UPI001CF14F1E|nr:uncharacterized protein LOC122920836 [Bufo gargarizans]XP_044126526.1 uncharacterized protein LOC122920836 [Bufo gargarizans]
MKGPENLLIFLLTSLGTADGLIVTMKAPLISAMRDENVTIPCEFSDFIPGKTINVQWMKSQNGNRTEVFQYIPGRRLKAFRAGSYMEEESEIQRGNAALHIPRVQFSDDGEYICIVVVTPDYKEGRSTLEVSAEPSVSLIPGDAIRVELGSEKVVSCDISNFYPEEITISWVRHQKDSTKCVVLAKGTCTGDSVINTDGTFNTSSQLTLYPTMKDDGYKYSCEVKHRSLQQDLVKNFTLTVTEREDNSRAVAAAVICTILGMAVFLSAGLLYYQVIKKEPPSVSEITVSEPLIDMSRTTLTCHIMNFKPNDLEIFLCLKRRGGEMKEVHTWRSRDLTRVGMDDVEQQRLMNGDVNHTQRPLDLEMKADLKPDRFRLLRCISWRKLSTYSCQCSIHITPSFTEDNGAEFSVRASHPALTEPSSQQRTLRVIGVAPTMLKISPARMNHEEPTTLTCPIIGFKPKPLEITWLKKDKNDRETELVRWKPDDGTDVKDGVHKVTENELHDKSYSFQSALLIKPTVREDEGATYICRTFHPATGQEGEQELVMAVTAVPVLGPIQQTKGELHVKEEMNLTCKIHSFYPAPIEVTWCTEDGRVLNSTLSDPLADPAGLYQVTSSMKYCPTLKDLKKTFTCGVRHESTGVTRKTTWKLEDLISRPTVSDISCIPPSPEPGTSVTLSCDVSDLYPEDFTFCWYNGVTRISEKKYKKEPFQKDPESGTFRGTVQLLWTTDTGYNEVEFRLVLTHCGRNIEKKITIILTGSPVLSDITSEPRNPKYGQPVTLRCRVTNANPKDVEVRWLKSDKALESGQGVAKQIPEADGSVSCSLQITATALDYAKAYTCSVKPKNMTTPLKKTHYIKLPDKVPTFSEISVRPERPVAGKEATFTATISGFTPDIRVKWYKEFDPFTSDFVTTSDPQIGKDSLCNCSSSLRFTPQDKDHGASIRCEVTHSVTKKVYEQLYTLRLSEGTPGGHLPPCTGHLKPPLKTKGIQCLTENPRVGGEVTLTCYVDGCDADHSEFSWRKGMFPIDSGIENRTLEDGSGSFSTVTFTAQETDRDCTMICEVNYNFQIQEEHFTLKLQ